MAGLKGGRKGDSFAKMATACDDHLRLSHGADDASCCAHALQTICSVHEQDLQQRRLWYEQAIQERDTWYEAALQDRRGRHDQAIRELRHSYDLAIQERIQINEDTIQHLHQSNRNLRDANQGLRK